MISTSEGASFLLDTNVVSEIARPRADARVVQFIAQWGRRSFLSVLTVGELHKGAARRRRVDPEGTEKLDLWIDGLVRQFDSRVVPVDHDAAIVWGRLQAERSGPVIETLLAATAISRGLVL